MSLLDIQNLTVALPPGADRPYAVENVHITLQPNEILCVIGESGSGKSITAQAIMGLLPPALQVKSGSIRFNGTDLLTLSEMHMRTLRAKRIAMIFQEPMTALNPLMRVGDQLAEIFRYHTKLGRAEIEFKVRELLAAVGLPEPDVLRAAYPFRLSGGQRQRVMIASALALEPSIIVADEPTTALDVTTQAQILRLIRKIQAERETGILYITHDFGVVAEIAHRVVVMQGGCIVESGTVEQVLNSPRHAYTQKLLAAVPRLQLTRSASVESRIVCRASQLHKAYERRRHMFGRASLVQAVKSVDIELRRGEVVGLVGESGSGKSTVGRMLVRLLAPDSGKILLEDTDLSQLRGQALRSCRRKIQMIFQDPHASLNPRRKVGDIIADPLCAHKVPRAAALAKARELLRLVSMDPAAADRYPHEFSGGQRQRIGIARAIALDPQVLVADEPVSALDVSVQAQILGLLEDLRRRLSLTMLFITHDLRVASQICDRILVMFRGEIVEAGSTSEVFANHRHPYTRELIEAIPGRAWRHVQ